MASGAVVDGVVAGGVEAGGLLATTHGVGLHDGSCRGPQLLQTRAVLSEKILCGTDVKLHGSSLIHCKLVRYQIRYQARRSERAAHTTRRALRRVQGAGGDWPTRAALTNLTKRMPAVPR